MTNFATLCILINPFQIVLSRDKKRVVSPSGGDRDSEMLLKKKKKVSISLYTMDTSKYGDFRAEENTKVGGFPYQATI